MAAGVVLSTTSSGRGQLTARARTSSSDSACGSAAPSAVVSPTRSCSDHRRLAGARPLDGRQHRLIRAPGRFRDRLARGRFPPQEAPPPPGTQQPPAPARWWLPDLAVAAAAARSRWALATRSSTDWRDSERRRPMTSSCFTTNYIVTPEPWDTPPLDSAPVIVEVRGHRDLGGDRRTRVARWRCRAGAIIRCQRHPALRAPRRVGRLGYWRAGRRGHHRADRSAC